jgi:glutathione transport system substrate-binding protein
VRTRSTLSRLLLLLAALALVAAACGDDDDGGDGTGAEAPDTSEVEGEPGGSLTFAAEQEPTGLNWLTAEDNAGWTQYIMQQVWPGAIFAEPDGTIVENEELVESVELTSEDPQTVVYEINPDAVWSDGEPIDAADFEFYWQAQNGKEVTGETDPETGEPVPLFSVPGTQGYELIESVEGSGDADKTVTVTYSEPFADWKGLFDYVFPRHAFAAAGGAASEEEATLEQLAEGWNNGYKVENLGGKDLAEYLPSAGPFRVDEYRAGDSTTLVRNEEYWGEPALLEEIVFPFIEDATQQPPALENGEADAMFPQAQLDLLQQVQRIQGVQSTVSFGTFWEHLDFNFNNEFLADENVRKAIGKAVDRQEIVERIPAQFDDSAEVLNNRLFLPNEEGYEDHGGEYAETEPEEARRLLEDAGFTEGAGGIYEREGSPLELRITYVEPNPRREQTARLVQSHLEEVGIRTEITPQPDFTFLDESNFDIALFGWTGGIVDSSETSIYVPEGGQNYAGHSNPEIEEKFNEANAEFDQERRNEIRNEIDELIWEDLPTLPLFQNPELIASLENVQNVIYNGYHGPTWNAQRWSLAQ